MTNTRDIFRFLISDMRLPHLLFWEVPYFDTGALFDPDQLPCCDRVLRDFFKPFDASLRPAHCQRVNLRLIVQSEIQPGTVLRRKARPGRHQTHLLSSVSFDSHQCTDSVAIALYSFQFYRKPAALLTHVVA